MGLSAVKKGIRKVYVVTSHTSLQISTKLTRMVFMEKKMVAELYKSATLELMGLNIPRHEFIDLRQELVCQTYSEHQRLLTKTGKEPDLLLLKKFLSYRKKELWKRSFLGKYGGGASTLDIMNIKHQWNGTFEKNNLVEYLPSMKMNTRIRAEDNMGFNVDIKMFIQKLTVLQKETMEMLLEGFRQVEIGKRLKQSAFKVKQIINSVKEAYLKYFGIKLQMAK